jgi:hypothetical protein
MEYRLPVYLTSFAQIELERTLSTPGQMLVRVGDKVDSTDIIARALHPGSLFAINAARILGVGNAALPANMLKKEGEEVKENQILAARGGIFGFFRRTCVSPVAGRIVSIAHGRILIEKTPEPLELRAAVRGEIVSVTQGQGATVRATGALLRVAWAALPEGYQSSPGVLRVIVSSRTERLTAEQIDVSCHGAIVVGGSGLDQETLERAEEMNVRAIVVGSIDASLRAGTWSYPVLSTEGFGSDIPMAEPTFQLLRMHQGREAVIIAQNANWQQISPQVIIPLPVDQARVAASARSEAALAVGMRVRLTRFPYTGMTGQVADMPAMHKDAETGIEFLGIKVTLSQEDGADEILAPLTNLELIQMD